MNKERHYLDKTDMDAVQDLVRRNGLRPVIDAVGAAALSDVNAGHFVLNEFEEKMDESDVRTAAYNLTHGDLF